MSFSFSRQSAIVTFGLAAMSSSALGQIDPSSALMLNNSRGANSAIDSGRYTVRPKSDSQRREEQRPPARRPREDEANVEPVTVTVPAGQTIEAPAPSASAAAPMIIRCEESYCPAPAPAPARELRRLNLMELSFAPGYMYNNSDSTYSFRTYTSATPTLAVDANVWLSPTFALHGGYTGTLSGHVSDSSDGSKNVPAMQEWFTAGFRSRKFFGNDVLSPVLYFGIDYFDYQFRVPADAATREKIRSTGVRLSLEAEIPANASRMRTIGVTLAPKLRHSESATAIDFQSGGNVDANAVGLSLGGRVRFERSDAIYWKLSHTVEKDLFSGTATKPDGTTGIAPSGVAVTNSFTLFEVGYTWCR